GEVAVQGAHRAVRHLAFGGAGQRGAVLRGVAAGVVGTHAPGAHVLAARAAGVLVSHVVSVPFALFEFLHPAQCGGDGGRYVLEDGRAVGGGPGGEEAEVLGAAVQGGQRGADDRVVDVPGDVDVEAVGPQRGAGGSRFDARKVDVAHRELVHGLHEGARGVVQGEGDAGAVGAG